MVMVVWMGVRVQWPRTDSQDCAPMSSLVLEVAKHMEKAQKGQVKWEKEQLHHLRLQLPSELWSNNSSDMTFPNGKTIQVLNPKLEIRGKDGERPLRCLSDLSDLCCICMWYSLNKYIIIYLVSSAQMLQDHTVKLSFRSLQRSPLDGTQWKERFVERWCFQGSVQQLDQFFAQRRCRCSHRRLGGCWCFLAQLTLRDELMDLPQVFQTAGDTTALLWRSVITVK